MPNVLAIEKTKFVVTAIFMLVFGILFIAVPESSYNVLTTIISWIIIVFGAVLCIHFLVNAKVVPWTNLISGIVTILVGIFLLIFPGIYIILISTLFIVEGVIYISNSIVQKKSGVMGWWKDLICGIIQIILGVAILVISFTAAASVVMIFLGVSLIFDSIFLIVALFAIKQNIKQAQKETDKK